MVSYDFWWFLMNSSDCWLLYILLMFDDFWWLLIIFVYFWWFLMVSVVSHDFWCFPTVSDGFWMFLVVSGSGIQPNLMWLVFGLLGYPRHHNISQLSSGITMNLLTGPRCHEETSLLNIGSILPVCLCSCTNAYNLSTTVPFMRCSVALTAAPIANLSLPHTWFLPKMWDA